MTLYAFAKIFIRATGGVLWRVRAYGTENVPRTGPVIFAANHLSYLDPPILGAYCPRQIAYMAKQELFAIPILGPTIRAVGAYPVDRKGSAASAIRRSVAILSNGGAVGLFPEGTRNFTGEAQPLAGAALLASLARAPVVPAALVGADRALRLAQIKVAFGAPLWLPPDRKATRDDLANFTGTVMEAIQALKRSIGGDS
jgi:1-acyl-sn-glycerol-3-phosphate acyltransferase